MSTNMRWFAVRSLFFHSIDGPGAALYEERICLYRAHDASEAIAAAEEDAGEYLLLNPEFRKAGPLRAFVISGKAEDLHRVEVWSQVLGGTTDVDAFYRERYARFEFKD